ncbi:hypothetical protein L7F22_042682 [Adiantum nelumboides]|nr:hypothetical protein [Adiantum nelumboides]
MVAQGQAVVAEYSPLGSSACSSFAALAARFLPHHHPLPHTSVDHGMLSFTCDPHTVYVISHDNYSFMVISNDSSKKHIALAFLQRIKGDFYKWYVDATTTTTNFEAHNLGKDFGSTMKEHMQYCVEYSHRLVRLESLKDQIQEVKEIATENIQRVQSLKVESNAIDMDIYVENFHKQGKQLKRQMWMHQTKVRVVALVISVVMILCIWLLVCKGFEC